MPGRQHCFKMYTLYCVSLSHYQAYVLRVVFTADGAQVAVHAFLAGSVWPRMRVGDSVASRLCSWDPPLHSSRYRADWVLLHLFLYVWWWWTKKCWQKSETNWMMSVNIYKIYLQRKKTDKISSSSCNYLNYGVDTVILQTGIRVCVWEHGLWPWLNTSPCLWCMATKKVACVKQN